jgi:hypothetical protein
VSLPSLDVQAPSAVEATIGYDHSLDTLVRDEQIGGDRVRVRIDRGADLLGQAKVVPVVSPACLQLACGSIPRIDSLGEAWIEREDVIPLLCCR